MLLLFFCVGLFALVLGSICGVGGVIIKPVLFFAAKNVKLLKKVVAIVVDFF